ncbi:MAG: hypothetical protein GXP55_02730 [Deltaproteobacteria bacterium]|nr:hypothetical protein [Deltaproteobacteria bacterium]
MNHRRTLPSPSGSKLTWALVACLALAASPLMPSPVSAQDVQVTGPLAGAPAVRRMRVYREGRLQLQPGVAISLLDEYDKAILFTLQAQYHLTDWLGVGVWGGYAGIHLNTDLTDQISSQGVSTPRNRLSLPSRQGFDQQIGQIQWTAALQATFIPLRGKLALFQKLFIDADLHLFLGAAFVGLEERADYDASAPSSDCDIDCSQSARATRVAVAPTFGLGLTMYINDYLGLSLEWRGMLFAWNRSGTDESGSPDGDFPDGKINSNDRFLALNHFIQIALTVYLPTEAHITE